MCRTVHPAKVLLLSKWSDSSVMWYIDIADEKAERFCLPAGVILYLTQVFTKRECCWPKWSYLFVMSFQIIIWFQEDRTSLLMHSNWCFHRNELSPLWCHIFMLLMRKERDLIFLNEGTGIWRRYQSATAASQNKVIYLWCISWFSSHWRKTE